MTYRANEFYEHIKGSRGIISVVARRMGVDWSTVKRAMERYKTVADMMAEEQAKTGDKAEENITDVIFYDPQAEENRYHPPEVKATMISKRLSTSKWYASRILKDKYSTKIETEETGDAGRAGLTPEERALRFLAVLKGKDPQELLEELDK